MKKSFTLLFILSIGIIQAQEQTTRMGYGHIQDRYLRISNNLNGIQMLNIKTKDKSMRGKAFVIKVKEYRQGQLLDTVKTTIRCKTFEIPIMLNGDSAVYLINTCESMSWRYDKFFEINMSTKLNQDSMQLRFTYSGGFSIANDYYVENSNYVLNPLGNVYDKKDREFVNVTLNKEEPIAVLSPPVKLGNGVGNYCLLNLAPVEEWYSQFDLEHFYIIYLTIVDIK